MDVAQSEYAEFLEMLIQNIMEHKPDKISVIATMPNGMAFNAIYGDCGPYDLAQMAFHLQADAVMEIVKRNARDILAAAEEEEEEE